MGGWRLVVVTWQRWRPVLVLVLVTWRQCHVVIVDVGGGRLAVGGWRLAVGGCDVAAAPVVVDSVLCQHHHLPPRAVARRLGGGAVSRW